MEEKILDLLEDICGDEVVKEELDLNLFEEGLLDSLDFTELLIGIEEACGVIIAPSEVTREDMDTPNKIIAAVKAKM